MERILTYIFKQPRSVNYNRMLLYIMPQVLDLKELSQQFAMFFIDSPEAE